MEDRTFVSLINKYQEKYGFKKPYFELCPNDDLKVIVVIPCFNEFNILPTLHSLLANSFTGFSVEVMVVINHSEVADEAIKKQNELTLKGIESFATANNTSKLKFFVYPAYYLPKKHAGVGLARKIGMDEAAYRFAQPGKDGIILAFDADSLCEPNYFQSVVEHFEQNNTPAASIHFEHPIEVSALYDENTTNAIIEYELHLRYYKNALAYAGHPFAFHTIGSSMAVKASAYAKQGGMNRRKAGEDFYFLSKMMLLGGFSEITTTKVIPSPRVSNRVPFGTGKAVGDILENKGAYLTYNFELFTVLKSDLTIISSSYQSMDFQNLSHAFKSYMSEDEINKIVSNARKNSSNAENYLKRLYQFFDLFWVLKYVHFLRDNYYPNSDVKTAAKELLKNMGKSLFPLPKEEVSTTKELLNVYRKLDMNQY